MLGYDLTRAVLTQEDEERVHALPFSLPDIVLIKKIHTDKKGTKQKGTKLKGQKLDQKQKDKGQGQGSGKGKKKERKVPKVEKSSVGGGDGIGGEEEGDEEEEELVHSDDTMIAGDGGLKGVSEGVSKNTGKVRGLSSFGEYDDDDDRAFEEFLLDINDDEDDDDDDEDDDDDDDDEEEDDDGDGGEEDGVSVYILSFFTLIYLFHINHHLFHFINYTSS